MTTPVIFRKEFGDSVIAFFPTLPGNMNIDTCQCYTHIGQHSSATKDYYVKSTEPAEFTEYESLLNELRFDIGYDDLVVRKNWIHQFDEDRIRQLKELRPYGN